MNQKHLENIFLKSWRPYVWLIVIGLVIYFRSIFFQFSYFDDQVLILENFAFLKNITNLFNTFRLEVFHALHTSAAYYRPFLTISFMFDAQIGANQPWIYHLTNINLHLIASCLAFCLLTKLGYRRIVALILALIFVVHPILTQAVAWIPGRNDSLLAIFIFLSFIFFINSIRDSKWFNYFLSILFFAGALFTKETSLVIIPIFILYLIIIVKDSWRHRNYLIYFFAPLVVIALWYFMRRAALVNPIPYSFDSILKSLWYNSPAIIIYLGKIVFPFNLSVLPILQDTTKIYGIIAIVLLAAAIYATKNKRWNYLIFGLIWFLFFLVPSFIRPNSQIVADFIEHRVYVAMFGFLIILAETFLFKKYDFDKKVSQIVVLLIILFLAILTCLHLGNFKNRLVFWQNAVLKSPHSPLAHRNLGAMYYLDNQADKAEPEYKKSIELNESEQMVHNNLGLIYTDKGMFKEAEDEYLKEIKYNPAYDAVYFNFGLLYVKQNKLDEAQTMWKKAIEINPDYLEAYNNLAAVSIQKKNYDEARKYVEILSKYGVKPSPAVMQALNEP